VAKLRAESEALEARQAQLLALKPLEHPQQLEQGHGLHDLAAA
jgi:hypothetical protein